MGIVPVDLRGCWIRISPVYIAIILSRLGKRKRLGVKKKNDKEKSNVKTQQRKKKTTIKQNNNNNNKKREKLPQTTTIITKHQSKQLL